MAKRVQKPPRVPHAPLAANTDAARAMVRRFVEQQVRIGYHRRQREDWERLHPPKAATPGAGWNHARTRNSSTL